MRQHLKAQERMSLENFYRSVHRIRSNKEHRKEENIVHGAEGTVGAFL